MQQPLLVFDCERMRYPNTGLYHFCWHLANALPAHLPQGSELGLYLAPGTENIFAGRHTVVPHHPWHRFYLKPAHQAVLWHCTHQGSHYMPRKGTCKTVLTVHDLNFLYDDRKSDAKKNRYLRGVNGILKKADVIVAISEYVKQDLLRHTNAHPDKISVIYNGCNINETLEPQAPAQQPPAPFLFTIGTIVDKKNFHVLPGMLAHTDLHLVIAGIVQSEGYQQKIMAAAKEAGVENRIHFTGAISEAEKYWYLQHCAAFVFPSLSEGFGLPVIEAMHFGKPALLSRATSLPEVGGTEAWYFDSFEPVHMGEVVEQALAEVQVNGKPTAIRQWAARYSWAAAAKAYGDLYRQLLA